MIWGVVCVALVMAPDPVLVEALTSLQTPTSVTATLSQTKKMKAFRRPQTATGRLVVVPPRKVRWEYTQPYRAILVINGQSMSMEYPDLGRKQTFDLATEPGLKAVIDTILFFLESDAQKVADRFEVEAKKTGKVIRLILQPRAEQAKEMVSRIEATIDLTGGVLTRLVLDEPDGDRTTLELSEIKTNAPVDERLLTP